MPTDASDLLLEIGVEELPASFVDAALRALPDLATKRLADLRLTHGAVRALGTPRRLTLIVDGLSVRQPDLEEEVTGPPVKAAYKDGAPTRAAEAFAQKLGVPVDALRRVEGPKGGEYVAGTRRETGRAAKELLPEMLAGLITAIPFRKSMRWGTGDIAFGRPIQWLLALHGDEVIPVSLAGLTAGRLTRGHRFLAPGEFPIASPAAYVPALRAAHVLVDAEERAAVMRERLLAAAAEAGGDLIEDEFLVGENLSLVEEPHIVVGGFSDAYLDLPERVILEVARGHQRYFCVRQKGGGALLPRYLTVVNTAEAPENIRRGGDRAMRSRLADARFFYTEDLKIPLAERRNKLAGIVFQKRLGSVLAKAERIELLVKELARLAEFPDPVRATAAAGAHLAKCDLVSLMVGEFPELQGEMGRAYALAQGVDPAVADVIRDHYQPRGAADPTPAAPEAALVSIADRLDTLSGCFALGITPTGAADPYGLRRACIGVLRTLLDQGLDVRLSDAFRASYHTYDGIQLDLHRDELVTRLGDFFAERLRGLLGDRLPADAVSACLAVAADRPLDVRVRAAAIAALDAETRARVGEVFKRATNIADKAPSGDPVRPAGEGIHPTEITVHDGYLALRDRLTEAQRAGAYADAFAAIAEFAPKLHQYFVDVYVNTDDIPLRENRLRLMRAIAETCSSLARLDLLGDTAKPS
ncbi:glycine--tRNA ligase subunit beta [Chondromyces apiculatus]|uniref:Glycine--tRNA ligase beta subunit n=1 Tax=Chondromyces apiculatus DSM 436 TaxID=1192034 RepID=A0A017T426_9BACT|nr:glycine--tRNA ligase subunit beta [Chondromyces apiculatus]EYF03998.1 Glycyl-tRNA synthetase beta chain [Chondromyces apiculatus DSM 436]